VSWGEIYTTQSTQGGESTKGRKVVEIMHSFGNCICSGGVAFSAAFASCVEPLLLLEALVVFLEFSVLLHDFLLVVLSPYLPLLED
jgi:hypothetical protein